MPLYKITVTHGPYEQWSDVLFVEAARMADAVNLAESRFKDNPRVSTADLVTNIVHRSPMP